MQHDLWSFRPMEVILTRKRKVEKHETELGVSDFLGCQSNFRLSETR